MMVSGRTLVLGIAAVLAAGFATAVIAQDRPEPGSLEALTAEIRQLRLAVEEAARSQTQTQALSVYLSAQQSRMVQVGGQLEEAQRDLDSMTREFRETEAMVARLNASLQRVVDPSERSAIEEQIQMLQTRLELVIAERKQAQSRYAELSQRWQVERGSWNDLISRLEGFTRR
jgi:chromosome segregation ATPase